ncbi:MFS transporter [Halopiger goleimassiliensis]|uniref:MFS transporter n=1 Tax=Halopiger goleimassiliensis TaxID=1293048 RepID=UPI0009DBA52E|nr:MFS transporter [Halopiger goleimassiliensis]
MSRLDSIRTEIGALWAGGAGKSLLAIALAWGLLNGTRMIYPVLLPYFSETFDLTLATAGLLVTIIWLCYAIGQVPGGILADRHGERTILTASVSFVCVGLVAVLLSPSAVVLFAATGLVGLGLSQYPIARMTALSDLYPDRIGSALGVTMASGDVGQTLLPPIASVLAVSVAWQLGLAFVLPLLAVSAAVIWLTLPGSDASDDETDTPADVAETGDASRGTDADDAGTADRPVERDGGADSSESVRSVLGKIARPTLLFTGFVMFAFIFVWQTFSAFYPTYLINEKEFSETVAGVLFGLFFAIGVFVKPVAGVAYDRIGIRGSLPLALSGAVVGFALLPFVEGLWPIVGVTVVTSTMLGSGAITQSYLTETIPEEIQGTGLGAIRSSAAALGATGPVLFGWVAERGYFDEGYLVMAGFVGVVTVLTPFMPTDSRTD